MTEVQNSAVLRLDYCQKVLNYQTNKAGEPDRFPWSSAHYKSSFMQGQPGSVNVEAGVVAGQWKAPLRLRLHCCPLVNDWAVGS